MFIFFILYCLWRKVTASLPREFSDFSNFVLLMISVPQIFNFYCGRLALPFLWFGRLFFFLWREQPGSVTFLVWLISMLKSKGILLFFFSSQTLSDLWLYYLFVWPNPSHLHNYKCITISNYFFFLSTKQNQSLIDGNVKVRI